MTRVIREAMLEAHQNVDNYGGVWFVLSNDYFDVVKESYFIEEDGTRKAKPWFSLYNTKDMYYGDGGTGHLMSYVDGKVDVVRDVDSVLEEVYENFEQPYGHQTHVHPKEMVLMGNSGHGKTRSVTIEKKRSVGMSTTFVVDDFQELEGKGILTRVQNTAEPVPNWFRTNGITKERRGNKGTEEEERMKKRKKRKKKSKKTHRKKK